ncbi:restriction endonuclease subunit S [Micromonospora echinaurantiaca]|uniref:restriction endonuclease subunit S n=1 Tax=Micromonospora echinaurantiaca TaxID=47857 RepID=UPI0034425E0D
MSDNRRPWENVALADVLQFREGPGILARDFRDEGVPLLRLAGLKRGASLLTGCNYLDPAVVEKRWSHFRVVSGDVLLSTSASLGEVAVVDESAEGAIPYTGIIAFRPKSDRILPQFVQFALTAPAFKRQIEAMGVGSVMRHFGPTHLKRMTIELPAISDQEAIAGILGALDDKIAVNERLALAAVELAEAHFAAATTLESRSVSVGDVALFHNRLRIPLSSKQRSEMPGRYPYYGANGIVDHVADFIFDGDYVLVGEDGTVVKDSGAPVVQDVHGRFWVNNHAHVLTGNSVSNEILLLALKLADVKPLVTGAVQPKLSMGNLKKLLLVLPTEGVTSQLESQLREIFELVQWKRAENRALGELRDALLPGLMSGAIQVRDAENAVEEAK